jgi:hypothetical protein
MTRLLRSRLFIACIASTITAVVVGGIAWAVQSPVDSNGVIHACYNPSNGNMQLNVKGTCPTTGDKTPITWNVTGPQGVEGVQGVQGNQGVQGIQGVPGPPGPAIHHQEIPFPSYSGIQVDPASSGPCGGPTYCFWNFYGFDNYPSTIPSPGSVARDLALNPGWWPAGSTVGIRFVLAGDVGPGPTTGCFRLFDITTATPVSGSDFCVSVNYHQIVSVISPAFALPRTQNDEYNFQAYASGSEVTVAESRILVDF